MGAAAYPKSPSSSVEHIEKITLDLPIPPSVNRTRRIDWLGDKKRREFYLRADLYLTAHGPHPFPVGVITGAFEIRIQIPESLSGIDLDNHCKALIDYLVSREVIPNDSKRYLRRLVVEWGSPTPACHVTIKALSTGLSPAIHRQSDG